MSGYIEDAMAWAQEIRHEQLSEPVLVGYTYANAKRLQASVPSSSDVVTVEGLNTSTTFFEFTFRTCDLARYEIKIHRGLKVWWEKKEFEVAMKAREYSHYSDPNQLDITLHTVFKG